MSTELIVIIAVVSFLASLWAMYERSWAGFTFFLALDFICGMTIYFRVLGSL